MPNRPLNNEKNVRERLDQQTFTPVKGGYQIQTVYLGRDLVVYVPRRRYPIYWDEKRMHALENISWINPLYQLARKLNSRIFYKIKQAIKYVVAWITRDPLAGPFAMIATLKGYGKCHKLEDLVDPFIIMDDVEIKEENGKMIKLAPVIIRERCDTSLLDELKDHVRLGQIIDAKKKIEETMLLDQNIWRKKLCNIDFSFKNYRIRNGRVVLRDGGHVVDDYDQVVFFLERLLGLHGRVDDDSHPIRKNINRMAVFSQYLADYYQERAAQVYTVENFKKCWIGRQNPTNKEAKKEKKEI